LEQTSNCPFSYDFTFSSNDSSNDVSTPTLLIKHIQTHLEPVNLKLKP